MSENYDVSPLKAILIAAVVLVGVSFGSWVILKKADKDIRKQAAPPGPMDHEPKRVVVPAGMVLVKGGIFVMGSNSGPADQRPAHRVKIHSFLMDATEVTNEEFAKFVEETGYVTVAERKPAPEDFPGVPEGSLARGGWIFDPPKQENLNLHDFPQWWKFQPGANWRHPTGPGSDIVGKEKYPVVQIAWDDTIGYAVWALKRLPTEAEWEYAARSGLDQQEFVWGNESTPDGKAMANLWQGNFPNEDLAKDGFKGIAPVGSFPPNRFGLYDMAGNVWEWCADWYHPEYYSSAKEESPEGPEAGLDPAEPGVQKRVVRGGSFLCNDIYCGAYRPAARMKAPPHRASLNTGFRCVRDVR
ncbi:MAG: Sulphatase-modifying factor protein [Verrucomicrobiales bacterium]|nr:Sulphatase-modifying factor protein [Verrucomicrobiales bacterium]